jgi:hypothetical protein
MKYAYNRFQRLITGLFAACVTLVGLALPAQLRAQDQPAANLQQQRFASSQEAIKTLRAAAEAGDRAKVHEIFGPEVTNFFTGDEVQDKANFKGFSEAMQDACVPVPEGDARITLNIGTNDWPFPIPLVKEKGQWFFDTEAGREEIINRHIGGDELHAIGVCRAYVKAQKQYFSQDRDSSGVRKYAQKFKSTSGQRDGLYWESASEPSPFGALVAEAHTEGYGKHSPGTGAHPLHGYLFHILTGQGRAAPGGKTSYLANGNLTAGFALVAYPDKWGKSGIMTFIVNQDGKVYQRNFGEKTGEIAASISEYNPDRHWKLVQEPGFAEQ